MLLLKSLEEEEESRSATCIQLLGDQRMMKVCSPHRVHGGVDGDQLQQRTSGSITDQIVAQTGTQTAPHVMLYS